MCDLYVLGKIKVRGYCLGPGMFVFHSIAQDML